MRLENEPASEPLHLSVRSAVERGRNNSNGFTDFHLNNGSSQGQDLALTGLWFSKSLGSGMQLTHPGQGTRVDFERNFSR